MKLDQIKRRYDRARANAIQAIDDLDQGADPKRVYREVEHAVLWKLLVMLEGKLSINMDVLDELLANTNGGGEEPVFADLPRDEAHRRARTNARLRRLNEDLEG